MSKFEEVFGKPKAAERQFTEIGGTFACQTCNKYSYEAKWYQLDKLLVWECSEEHKSYIEGFQI